MGLTPVPTRRGRIYIKRWVEPKVGEPAHGFMQRIALANHQDSAAAFARKLDLSNPRMAEGCLLAVSGYEKAPPEHIERLRRWTPRFDGFFGTINGQTIRLDDWSTQTRRFCAACLAEEAFHRTWFDLTFVHRCPFHGTPVTDLKADGLKGSFHTAETTFSPAGVRLTAPSPRLEDVPETIEAYAVGRLGLMPFEELPFLANATVAEVVAVSDILGRLALEGWQTNMPPLEGERAGEKVAAIAVGFAVLRQGETGIKELLRRVADEAPADIQGARTLFGWLKMALSSREILHWSQVEGRVASEPRAKKQTDRRALFEVVGELCNNVAAELGRHARREARHDPSLKGLAMTMTEVATEVGQTPSVVLGLARTLDLLPPHTGGKGKPHLMLRTDVPKIAAALAGSLTRSEAAEMLGISYELFLRIGQALKIPKVGTRWGQRDDGVKDGFEDRFERRVITDFLDSIPVTPLNDFQMDEFPRPWPTPISIAEVLDITRYNPAEFFKALMAGDIPVERTGTDRGLQDFEVWPQQLSFALGFTKRCMSGTETLGKLVPGMQMREAAALLEVNQNAVSDLAENGHFGDLPGLGTNKKCRLERGRIADFFQRYSVAPPYAEALGCSPGRATYEMEKLLKPAMTARISAPNNGRKCVALFFEREEVRRALGIEVDPEASDHNRIVWKRLVVFLGINKSVFSVSRIAGQVASLRSANNVFTGTVAYEFADQPLLDDIRYAYRYSIVARLTVDGEPFRRHQAAMLPGLRERRLWPEMKVGVDETAGRLEVELPVRFVHHMLKRDWERLRERGMAFVERYSADDVEVIEHMLHMIKGALEPSDRPFDLRTFGAWNPVRYRAWCEDELRCQLVRSERSYRIPRPSEVT